MEKILLFIPVYNCERKIGKVLESIPNAIMKDISKVLIIDTNSTDNTKEEVQSFKQKHKEIPITLLVNDLHQGLGTTTKLAFRYAYCNHYDYVCMVKGDNLVRLADFKQVFQKKLYRHYDAILGARFMKGSTRIGYKWPRSLGNIGMDMIYSLICKRKIYDTIPQIAIYATSIFEDKFYVRFPENNLFLSIMNLAHSYYQHKIRYIPITCREDGIEYPVKRCNQSFFLLKWAILFWKDPESIRGDYRGRK